MSKQNNHLNKSTTVSLVLQKHSLTKGMHNKSISTLLSKGMSQ